MKNKGLNNFEKGLIFAIVLTPFTLLRIGYIGFGEISLLLLFLAGLQTGYISKLSKDLIFSRFWIIFLIVSFCGFAYNVIFLNQNTGTFESSLFDFAAYVLIFISCLLVENLYLKDRLNIYQIIRRVFFLSGFIFTALYALSMIMDSVLGLPLKYFEYFAPFVNNLHQTAMFIAPMPFIGLFVLEREKKKLTRLVIMVLILILSYLTLETGSFKAMAGLGLGWLIYFLIKFINLFRGNLKKAFIAIAISMVVLVIALNIETIYNILWAIFSSEDLAEGRTNLYTSAIDVGLTSPVIGLGPGAHIYQDGQFWDSHASFLTVFLQGGVIGLILFLILFYRLSRNLLQVTSLLAASMPILIYALGGDIMRRLPIWLLLLLLNYYIVSEQKKEFINE
ncbi:MAG: O-antigen ligase family protein [Bacteroidia bacterium]|nr:O-antigen ligase family protein [Bacteroidia bacterium]MBT8276520.1 O-antigen ligase family protein [Bacteroidia bacterium]NNF30502.1 O-antigen ligase family protein [Flavobacteriaceae bacterium]NNK53850.1 O-antigen ligase family protein [Flavobacteriaceae bacterium]NNM09750.1 O-antigen ligase family protein [Flavobacteriaceae bacterium]